MPIPDTTHPKTPSLHEQSIAAVMAALTALTENPLDLAAQAATTFVTKKIGGFQIEWSKGLALESPPYLTSSVVGVRELHLLSADQNVVATYFHDEFRWRRHAITADVRVITASLPRRALYPTNSNFSATPRQLAALRKALGLAVDHPLPPLHHAKVSQFLDRLFLEPKLPHLARDVELWLRYEPIAV